MASTVVYLKAEHQVCVLTGILEPAQKQVTANSSRGLLAPGWVLGASIAKLDFGYRIWCFCGFGAIVSGWGL